MNSDEATVAVIDALQTLGIPYILVGSLASNLYGIPRSTNDADFSVQVGAGGIRAIAARGCAWRHCGPRRQPGLELHPPLVRCSRHAGTARQSAGLGTAIPRQQPVTERGIHNVRQPLLPRTDFSCF